MKVPSEAPLVVIGGSAGAIEPLRAVVAALPADLPAAVCVVVHIPASGHSALPSLLRKTTLLPARFADDGSTLSEAAILVAPPGQHLLVADGHVSLSRGAHVNGSRPAIDPLFRSAAAARGARVVSVVLSGTLDDGAAGTVAVHRSGGTTIVQDPAGAAFPDMPANAIATGMVTHVATPSEIGLLVVRTVERLAAGGSTERPHTAATGTPALERSNLAGAVTVDRGLDGPARDLAPPASPYACPACGGVLYERDETTTYLCRVGHRYSPNALAHGQASVVEDALWTALRTLEESSSLAERVRERAVDRGDAAVARRFEARRDAAEARAERIRIVLREPGEDVAELVDRGA